MEFSLFPGLSSPKVQMRFSLPNHSSSRGYRGLSYSTAKQLNMYISQKIFMLRGERAVVRHELFQSVSRTWAWAKSARSHFIDPVYVSFMPSWKYRVLPRAWAVVPHLQHVLPVSFHCYGYTVLPMRKHPSWWWGRQVMVQHGPVCPSPPSTCRWWQPLDGSNALWVGRKGPDLSQQMKN